MPAKYATPDDVADVADLANRVANRVAERLGRIEQRLATVERILAERAGQPAKAARRRKAKAEGEG
jgi:hypothetical protein